ncbi:MAG TPA: crossover junction endodeoxyribonuclease RuvC [Lentisphaeria bacterium]|nr:MAG: crossover junction endodeoxyribonuclease RuvC [Lentisphaerae bacterium GWF2_38_69]HBM17001.1 crossover junction endodeoxyribonuclease RuvC [Lentisphaeria bacterium]
MVILGVDTALRCTGYGIINANGDLFKTIDCGLIKNRKELPQSKCLTRLYYGIQELVKTFKVDVAAIEGAFFGKNVRTTMILGYARGAVMTALSSLDIPIYAYSPKEVKMAAGGIGTASKEQVATIMSSFLGIDISQLEFDATDALGLALCHANRAMRQDSLYTLNSPI